MRLPAGLVRKQRAGKPGHQQRINQTEQDCRHQRESN